MDALIELNQLALLNPYRDFVLLAVRTLFAIVFLWYGWPKLKDLSANADDFRKKGFRPGWFWGTLIALLETGGSLLVLLGLFLAVIPILFALHMTTGTIWKITATEKPFSDWSYDLLLLGLSLVFLVAGPGELTILALLTG